MFVSIKLDSGCEKLLLAAGLRHLCHPWTVISCWWIAILLQLYQTTSMFSVNIFQQKRLGC